MNKVKINKLKKLAIDYAEITIENKDIRINDITEIFLDELKLIIKNEELINIQIIGQVTTGKSTLGMKLLKEINNILKKPTTLKNICADQLEFGQKIKDKTINNMCIMIDEWNALSESGLNATVEQKFLRQFSEVQAQRYIHRIGCSPTTIIDELAEIIIDIIGIDKRNKTTTALISYKIFDAIGERTQLIGHIKINVSDIFEETWWKRYRKKKFEKMNLLIEEGIKDIRELKYAEIILEVRKKLINLARLGLVNKEIIVNYVEKIRRENKEILSILTSDDIITKIKGLLEITKQKEKLINIIENKQKKLKNDKKTKRINENEIKQKIEEIKEIAIILNGITKTEEDLIANYIKLREINKKYENI